MVTVLSPFGVNSQEVETGPGAAVRNPSRGGAQCQKRTDGHLRVNNSFFFLSFQVLLMLLFWDHISFGRTVGLVGSQFPDQGSNPGSWQ